MVKVSNISSKEETSCTTSQMNGYHHQQKQSKPMSSFSKNLSSYKVCNEVRAEQHTSPKSSKDHGSPVSPKQLNMIKFSKIPKKDDIVYSKSPPASPGKKHHFSTAVNGIRKSFAPGSPKWTGAVETKPCHSSPEHSPVKNLESAASMFNISKQKSQPVLYRKMFGVFKKDHEVLARWSDGLYYLGTVRQVEDFQHRCYVQFEDKSTCWVHFKDLQSITKESDEETASDNSSESDVICAICRDGKSEKPNEIVLCDKCGQGFHQLCHAPAIDTKILSEEDETWHCRTCVFAAVAKKGGAEQEGPAAANLKQMKEELPYDIRSLTWDKGHRSNTEETYCYCGGPGDWYLKMLQCCRCLQWYHEACLQCLEDPVLYGDRFFLFVCSICNGGNEFLKRLPMRWVDVVHLVLYNITITKTNKYYDFSSSIIPYFAQNWESLRLGELVHEASTRSQLKDRVFETLQNNKSRFQCGNESKKGKPSWGLKTRSPPSPPTVAVPTTGIINEKLLQSMELRHGSMLLSDSPTPLKRSGPGDLDRLPDSPTPKIYRQDLYAVNNINRVDDAVPINTSSDNLFERFYNDIDTEKHSLGGERVELQRKRKRGRPRKDSNLTPKSSAPSISLCGRPRLSSNSSGKIKKKDPLKTKKEAPAFASENSVLPISELFRDIPGTNTMEAVSGSDIYDQELRRNMARYFGAEGRIALGERFNVLAKRVLNESGSDGPKVEYLIEWEGCTAQQLHESVQKR